MPGLRGVPNRSHPRRHVYSGGGMPTPPQFVDQHHGSQDGKRYQDDQHDGHRHPPIRRSPNVRNRGVPETNFPNWTRSLVGS
jgi:hypothetical protein